MRGIVTTWELADELDVRPETVVRWIREHKLSAFRRAGRWCIPREEAQAFAEEYERSREEDEDFDDDDDE